MSASSSRRKDVLQGRKVVIGDKDQAIPLGPTVNGGQEQSHSHSGAIQQQQQGDSLLEQGDTAQLHSEDPDAQHGAVKATWSKHKQNGKRKSIAGALSSDVVSRAAQQLKQKRHQRHDVHKPAG